MVIVMICSSVYREWDTEIYLHISRGFAVLAVEPIILYRLFAKEHERKPC